MSADVIALRPPHVDTQGPITVCAAPGETLRWREDIPTFELRNGGWPYAIVDLSNRVVAATTSIEAAEAVKRLLAPKTDGS